MLNNYTFKLITTGETLSFSYRRNLTVYKFLIKLRILIKQRFNIENFTLIQGGTSLGELGHEYNFDEISTRITTIEELFKDTECFYIKEAVI